MRAYLFLSICLFCAMAQAQDVIGLINPSMEGKPNQAVPPPHWNDCGFIGESEADTQPGSWEVTLPAQDKDTYLGMVVRENDTWEAVSQRLMKPMQAGKCYELSLYLSRSDVYLSPTKSSRVMGNYVTPTVLRIYGGKSVCDRGQLLAESHAIQHDYWKEYHFKLEVDRSAQYLVLEVYYKTPVLFPYNGHILVDNLSDLEEIPCNKEVLMVVNEPVENSEEFSDRVPQRDTEPVEEPKEIVGEPVKEDNELEEEDKGILKDLDRKQLKPGSRIELKTLYFKPDSFRIEKQSEPVLQELLSFLNNNQDIHIEIGGHTNGLCSDEYCFSISEKRANAVANYLLQRGISEDRITAKGYGKTRPIADNATVEGRSRNQRVEVKITSLAKQ